MLIKVTTTCHMGCSHCLDEAGPDGTDMTAETFLKALDFAAQIEAASPIRATLLSGGEPTDNPLILDFIDEAVARKQLVMLLTNGLWLADEQRKTDILSRKVFVQVTNDPRFYPKQPPRIEHPGVAYADALSVMIPLGRFKGQKHAEVPSLKAPACFNLRSVTRSTGDVRNAVAILRTRSTSGIGGLCTPSITPDGTVVAGESRLCHKIGTVDSTPEEITQALTSMRCNQCGLLNSLSQEHKRAIGESLLYIPHERFR